MNPNIRRMVSFFVAALLLWVAMPTSTAYAQAGVTQGDIQGIKDELADIQAQKKAAEERLAAIRSDLSTAKEQVELIQNQVVLTEQEINVGQEILDGYDVRIAEQTRNIQMLEEQEAEQYQEFYQQVRWLEETGNTSYLSILFEADSFSDLLDYAALVMDIMNYSDRIIQRLEATQAELDAARSDLQADRDAQAQVQRELEERRAELERRRADAQALLNQIAASESEFAAEARKLADSEAQLSRDLKEAEQKFAEQIAALQNQNNAAVNVTTSSWYWPLPGRYGLSSLFGTSTARWTTIPAPTYPPPPARPFTRHRTGW